MYRKLWRFGIALLPICLLTAQQPSPHTAQQANRKDFLQPSPKALRRATQDRQRMRAQAIAINHLAGHVQSLDDARKLVNLVAAEFSHELPPRWAARSIRNRIARAEYDSAAVPGGLIPEQRVADSWDDYLQKIGAPQEDYVTAAEIHTLRDSSYVTSHLFWARGLQEIWTVPNIYAIGPDGKVANGCRALEVLDILWQLANQPKLLKGTRELIKKDERLSDMYKNPSRPPAPGTEKSYITAGMTPPNPVEQAAYRYARRHGVRAFNRAVDTLLKELFAG